MIKEVDNELKKAQLRLLTNKLIKQDEEMQEMKKPLFDAVAKDLKMQYDSFVSQGFTNEQAFELLKIKVKNEPFSSQNHNLKNYMETFMKIFKRINPEEGKG